MNFFFSFDTVTIWILLTQLSAFSTETPSRINYTTYHLEFTRLSITVRNCTWEILQTVSRSILLAQQKKSFWAKRLKILQILCLSADLPMSSVLVSRHWDEMVNALKDYIFDSINLLKVSPAFISILINVIQWCAFCVIIAKKTCTSVAQFCLINFNTRAAHESPSISKSQKRYLHKIASQEVISW